MFESLLHWLEHTKPLWDFLTAIGTIGLALVTVWLANRKSKPHLSLDIAQIDEGESVRIRATNDGTVAVVFLRFYWRSSAFSGGRIDLTWSGDLLLNGNPPENKLPRLVPGDVVDGIYHKRTLTSAGAEQVPANIDDLDSVLTDSRFLCVLTTGEAFEAPLPKPVRDMIGARIRLERRKI